MGILLENNAGNTFEIKNIGWCYMLNLGEQYGWKPIGTQKPKKFGVFRKWSGGYDSSDEQIVISSDSNNFASALKKALNDSNFDERSEKLINDIVSAIENSIGQELGYSIEIDKKTIEELVIFLEKGQFIIK